MKVWSKRVCSGLLASALLVSNLPPVHVMAAENENLSFCEHHMVHEDYGYVEGESGCDFVCERCTQVTDTDAAEEPAVTEVPVEQEGLLSVPTEPVVETVTVQIVPEVELPDNTELFAAFAERELYGYEIATFGITARASLNAIEKQIYDTLKAKIETVALSGGSTVFSVSGISGMKASWTNEELGVSSIDSTDGVKADFLAQFDRHEIVTALLSDCPFDLYWYDKTVGTKMNYQISRSGYKQNGATTWDKATVSDLTFTFTVSSDYDASTYAVTSNVAKVTTAKNNAASVVAANASKSDYEKLIAYKEYICDAVSYNHPAADDNSTPYGDPWQLISVFDGNVATEVVCEGYSKAFQYLCDLGGLDCISVSGTMTGGTGSGGHMWNVVTLDGKNYLVDVTNCDEGTAGAPDKLFLVGASYVGGGYSFDCGYQTLRFICSNQNLAEKNYSESQQPSQPVTTYTVTVEACENGTVTASSTTAEAGTVITLTVTPAEGYALKSLTVKQGTTDVTVTDNQFTMPEGDVTVTAEFKKFLTGTCGENLIWSLDEETGTLTIDGSGSMTNHWSSSNWPWYSWRTDIKTVVINEGVTRIGACAFEDCSSLTSITIPEGVISIGSSAFENCSSLTSISIPEGVTSIGSSAFENCSSLTSITIPEGVTSIGNSAFSSCSSLTSITIPEGVTSIGDSAFYGCSSLTSITIPESVTSIGDYAFYDCSSLMTSINIPEGVTSIGYYAFRGCSSLCYIILPATLKTIDAYAFYYCNALKHVLYAGTAQSISIGSYNTSLTNATWHYEASGTEIQWIKNCENTGFFCTICFSFVTKERAVSGSHVYTDGSDISCNDCDFVQKLTDISIQTNPTQAEYVIFQEELNLTGGSLRLNYNEGASVLLDMTADMITGFDSTTLGYRCLQVSYGGFSQSFYIRIVPGTPDGLEITSPADKTMYLVGEALDQTGLVLTAKYDNHGTVEIPLRYAEISRTDMSTPGTKVITLTVGETSVSYDIVVHSQYQVESDVSDYPESDHNYASNTDETKTFTVPGAYQLRVTFSTDTLTESESDYIYLYDGQDNQIAAYPGTQAAGKTITIPGDTLKVRLVSDASVNKYGYAFSSIVASIVEHNFGDWTVIQAGTCEQEGLRTRTCLDKGCNYTERENFFGHTEVIDPAVEPTCTATGLTEGKHCSVCEEVLVKQKTIAALDHKWTDADCDTPKTCSVCKATEGKPDGHKYDDNVDGTCSSCGVNREAVETRQVTHMLRMYNPYTGEHFYTGSEVEKDNLVAAGWRYEGVGFTFPANTGAPVHRLYDPVTGEHLYTMNEEEKAALEDAGWNYEGIAFNSAYDTEAVQHRLHNPYATVGAYHFTFSDEEKQNLINAGWEYQGIGWYSCWK